MLQAMIGQNSPLSRLRQRQRVRVQPEDGGSRRAGLTSEEERLLHQILAEPMDYIDSDEFTRPDAERRIYDEAPPIERPDVSWYRPLMDDPEPSRGHGKNSGTVLLTAAQERVLFLQYNYARHRVRQLQMEIGPNEPTEDQARELLRWYCTATEYREQIAETNLALVLAMAQVRLRPRVQVLDLRLPGHSQGLLPPGHEAEQVPPAVPD
jgi:hypothetical protein